VGSDLKICSRCHKAKPIQEFSRYKDRSLRRLKSYCKSCRSEIERERRKKEDKVFTADKRRDRRQRVRLEWLDWFRTTYGENPTCEVCGKILQWQNGGNGVIFDHRNGRDQIITRQPSNWYQLRSCNEKSRKVFLSHNFGILCNICNLRLPTEKRGEWFKNIERYLGKPLI
jgi:hypothetical protein